MSSTADDRDRSPTFDQVFDLICSNVSVALRGKEEVVRLAVTCLLARGHLLIEDVPGVGKTSLAKALARSVDASFSRVQFTPDLLPSDILGSSVWNQDAASFEFRPGPIFTHLLLGDEINRASPKTQSALLEAMAEHQVTVDCSTHELTQPFMVVATQNPLEHHGTFPLPESQLDRFLMKVSVGYPDRGVEISMLLEADHEEALERLEPVVPAIVVNQMAVAAQQVHVSTQLAGYLVDLAERSRTSSAFSLGISPRASLGLLHAARVWAASQGRSYVTPDDVKELAIPVLAHRVVLAPDSRIGGSTTGDALVELLHSTPVPS